MIPKKFGKHSGAGYAFRPHAQSVQPSLIANLGIEGAYRVTAPAYGVLTLTVDSLRYIVPNSSKHHVVSKYVYTLGTGTKKHTSPISSSGYYDGSTGTNGGYLFFETKVNGIHWVIDAKEDSSATNPGFADGLFGFAYSGHGTSLQQTGFEAGVLHTY